MKKPTLTPQKPALTAVAALLLSIAPAKSQAQTVVINELMQSNIDCVMDDLNEFPDSWVELYNTSATPVSLSTYSIGTTEKPAEAWKLPSVTIPAHGYVLVFCDKEANDLHTNFRLDSGKGGSVYLFNADKVEDKVKKLAKQPAPNISYGRKTDGGKDFGYQSVPTPKASNCGETIENILGDPVFSQKGRVYAGASQYRYTVTLSLPEDAPEGTVIRYTIDGTEPTESSPLYSAPLSYFSTKVIRAKLFCKGWLSPRSVTESYIVHPRTMSLPVISIVTDRKFFFDDKIGIYVKGTYKEGTENYKYDWRRPINFEYYEQPESDGILNQLCEVRVSGGASRGAKFKSLALYANKRFGEKHFKHEFFPDQRPGLSKYKSLVLRNAGNDFDYLYMRDAIAQRSVAQHVDLDWQAYRPAIIYLNGEYYGILNIRERANESNVYTNYDGLEDVDGIENWWDLKEGDMKNLDAFKAFFNEHGHTWAEYEKWMDVNEYINLVILNAYYNNVDFFGNNIFMWRPRTDDGRWRFIAKDVDYTIGIYGMKYDYKYFNWVYDANYDPGANWGANSADATRLFRRLMEDSDFKRCFLDRFAVFMGDFLNYDAVWNNVWSPMYETIKTEYPSHRALINQWWPNYSQELSSAQNWLRNRTAFVYKHLSEYFKLGTPTPLLVNNTLSDENRDKITVLINDIPLTEGRFVGKFFENRSVTLKAISKDETLAVTAWNIRTVSTSGKVTDTTVVGDTCTFTMPTCSQISVNAVLGVSSGIKDVVSPSANGKEGIYTITGIRLSAPKKGINILSNSRKKLLKR